METNLSVFGGFAAPLCGKASPFRRAANPLFFVIKFFPSQRKGTAFPHSKAAEPLVDTQLFIVTRRALDVMHKARSEGLWHSRRLDSKHDGSA